MMYIFISCPLINWFIGIKNNGRGVRTMKKKYIIYITIGILVICFLGVATRKIGLKQSPENTLQTNDIILESDIDAEILYEEVSDDGKQQRELSSTQDAYMYYHKTLDYNIAVDIYNTGYLNMAIKRGKYMPLQEYIVDLSESYLSAYRNLQWDELKKSDVIVILENLEKFESDYIEGKIVFEKEK